VERIEIRTAGVKLGRKHTGATYDDAVLICDLLRRKYTPAVVSPTTRLIFHYLTDDVLADQVAVEHIVHGVQAPLGTCEAWVNDLLHYCHNHDPLLFPPKNDLPIKEPR